MSGTEGKVVVITGASSGIGAATGFCSLTAARRSSSGRAHPIASRLWPCASRMQAARPPMRAQTCDGATTYRFSWRRATKFTGS
jgi:hypothetical protein